jgi:hexokinase
LFFFCVYFTLLPAGVDETPDLMNTSFILKEKFNIDRSTLEDRKVVKQVCTLVARRAARLAAAGIAGCVLQMKEAGEGVIVDSSAGVSAGIDGSVFKKHPLVRGWMAEALRELGVPCELHEAVDGSGRGAAIVAVTAAKTMALL